MSKQDKTPLAKRLNEMAITSDKIYETMGAITGKQGKAERTKGEWKADPLNQWVKFETDTNLKCAYQIVGTDLRLDVRIKILTPMPRGYYHSAVNEAGEYYDMHILPNLQK